mmetsp:Transcript_34168/g.54510  ORF Transcript_34168/g.54510 Transcript_34168/m.54510 type:complete len:829 (-) Transcript_34168:112-2598(-)|eukprot:CAMPEP_0169118294 /NCGR_PEP_ID=MMETSP1015-20121227/30921_1 /TAXON_ID=342587 /ORGANISM="Karlodinium micrum, Strain CCMP2283" /LENGTH=828 /DNA_ID=CAMNT_0009181047 /DNA_START=27 /DNA_END=2513 /DNA_ORIENTATION=-
MEEDAELEAMLAEADGGDEDDEDAEADEDGDEPNGEEDEDALLAADLAGDVADDDGAADDDDEDDDEDGDDDEEGSDKESVGVGDTGDGHAALVDVIETKVDAGLEEQVAKRRGKPKDPKAPKRPLPPYYMFAGTERERLKENNSPLLKDLKALGKAMADSWAQVPQATKDKMQSEYDIKKAEYDTLMEAYKKTESFKSFQKELAAWMDMKKMKKLIKKQKAVTPARPKSAYMAFTSKVREEIQETLLGKAAGEVAKILADRWQTLPAKEQEQFQAAAKVARAKWEAEMIAFKRTEQYRTCIDEQTALELKQALRRLQMEYADYVPKRPSPALRLWATETGTKGAIKDVSKQFQALSENEQSQWKAKAESNVKAFQDAMKAFQSSKEGKRLAQTQASIKKKIAVSGARKKYLVDAPKRPASVQVLCSTEDVPGRSGKWTSLSPDSQKWWEEERARRFADYEQKMEEFKKSDNWKLFEQASVVGTGKGKTRPKPEVPESMPRKPSKARDLWAKAQHGSGLSVAELAKRWEALGEEGQRTYKEQEQKAVEVYESEIKVWAKTDDGKKYFRAQNKGKAKAKPKAKTPVPDGLPAKPPKAFAIWKQEQKDAGAGLALAALAKKWQELGAEGQRIYAEKADTAFKAYEAELEAWKNSKEGKKHARSVELKKEKAKTKKKSEKARATFLNSADAPEAPVKPKNAKTLYCEEMKVDLMKADPKLGVREVSKRSAALWDSLGAEDRQKYESKAKSLHEVYEFELAAYKETPAYKAYEKAAGLGGSKGRGGGRGGGRGKKRKAEDDEFLKASGLFDDSDDLGLGDDSDGMGLDSDED